MIMSPSPLPSSSSSSSMNRSLFLYFSLVFIVFFHYVVLIEVLLPAAKRLSQEKRLPHLYRSDDAFQLSFMPLLDTPIDLSDGQLRSLLRHLSLLVQLAIAFITISAVISRATLKSSLAVRVGARKAF